MIFVQKTNHRIILNVLIKDPELKKEMEEQMKTMNKGGQVPDMSELMSSIFGGQPAVKKSSKSSKKKN